MKQSNSTTRLIVDRIKTVIGNHVLVRTCAEGADLGDGTRGIVDEDGKLVLELPEMYWDSSSQFVEIVDVGVRCKVFTRDTVGGITWCPESSTHLHSVPWCDDRGEWRYDFWMCRETILWPVLINEKNEPLPLKDYVVVLTKDRDMGGIAAPETWDFPSNRGKVLWCGPECRRGLQGKDVILPNEELRALEVDGKTYTLVREGEIVSLA